jgi:predicted  nucleic acid-binding Zn-ribbon protein
MGVLLMKRCKFLGFHQDTPWTTCLQSKGTPDLKGLMKEMLEDLTATHEDVRYVRTTVTMLAQSDAAHEAAIESLRKRLERVERKVGSAKYSAIQEGVQI